MFSRISCAVVLSSLLVSAAAAQTVRFDTNVGNFDVVLNPNDIPELQGHVDNFLGYVNGGFYDNLLINRTPDNFVMQLGRFSIESIFVPMDQSGFIDNRDTFAELFDPVIVDEDDDGTVDFDTSMLSNTRNTISLALNGTNSNSGTSEFFVNFRDNGNLDPSDGTGTADFVTFAMVPDMTTIDLINQLTVRNLFGSPFDDVRLLDNDTVVYVERAFVLSEPVAAASAGGSGSSAPLLSSSSFTVPEPSSFMLAAGALLAISLLPRRKV